MRFVNIALDLYGGAICLILFARLFPGKSAKNRMRRYFIGMCGFNLGMALGDIPCWAFDGLAKPWYPAALWSGTLLFWLCSALMLFAFTGYLIEYLAPKVTVHRYFRRLAAALCALYTAGILLSVSNGMFFAITPENIYRRGSWFWLSQALPFSMYALDILIFLVYRKSLPRRDFGVLSSYILFPLAAEVGQIFLFRTALLSAGVSLGLLIIFVNLQSEQELRIERQEKELAQDRIAIMLSQIKPHFLYNSLTAIRRLCDRDPAQAKAAIQDFSLFLRANMDSLNSRAPIPFAQELSHTRHYLALEQQRFRERLRVVYEIGAQDFCLPPLTLQPIAENAVAHGILRREQGGTVVIRTAETARAWVLSVRDDGVGFSPASSPDSRSHIGIENVRARLAALCGGTLEIKTQPGDGTLVTITIPKKEAAL